MSLTTSFHSTPTEFRSTTGKAKRPAPFSLRLSESEKADLAAMAGGRSLAACIRERLFSDVPASRTRRAGFTVRDRDALAQVLALLGRSRLANNLNQLAYAVNIGALPLTPETEAELSASLAEIREMRSLLLLALGMKAGGAP